MRLNLLRCLAVRYNSGYAEYLHPTQKPVALMGWCLDRNEPKGVIDPFMGSGSAVLACRERGIPCIGIECEKTYFEATARRLRQGLLFAG